MSEAFDLEAWLSRRSIKLNREAGELIFEHRGNDKSLLLTREIWQNSRNQKPHAPGSVLYEKHAGGYIGNGYLLIATLADASVKTSTGIVIPTLEEMRSISESQGMIFRNGEIPFMTVGYMFVYSALSDGTFCCHDRDFQDVEEGGTIREIFEKWWDLKAADQRL